MSSIAFHSKDKTVRVGGRERAMMGKLVNDAMDMATNIHGRFYSERDEHPLRPFIAGYFSNYHGRQWTECASMAFNGIMDDAFATIEGVRYGLWQVSLNSALVLGDAMWLTARLHGQCEIHAWVDGPNRKWLASVIERGLDTGIFREETQGYEGWRKVIEMLLADDSGPVVTSYSVCESFPNAHVAGWKPTEIVDGEADWDAWYNIPQDQRWDMAMEALRKAEGCLELKPNDHGFHFGAHNVNGWQLMQLAYKHAPKEVAK